MKINQRLNLLEAKLHRRGREWWQRQPLQAIVSAWKAHRENGLYLDYATGKGLTLAELQQADPDRAERVDDEEARMTRPGEWLTDWLNRAMYHLDKGHFRTDRYYANDGTIRPRFWVNIHSEDPEYGAACRTSGTLRGFLELYELRGGEYPLTLEALRVWILEQLDPATATIKAMYEDE